MDTDRAKRVIKNVSKLLFAEILEARMFRSFIIPPCRHFKIIQNNSRITHKKRASAVNDKLATTNTG
jgi:hypothetical protein